MNHYDTDFSAWIGEQADLLRRRASGDLSNDAAIDYLNIAEELEALGRSERRELENRFMRLMQHLLKWQYQSEMRSRSWRSTIRTQRRELEKLLRDNPSLKASLAEVFTAAFLAAREEAADETGLLNLPDTAPFTLEYVLESELNVDPHLSGC